MIEHLRASKTANFHRLKRPLSNSAIDDLFRQLRASQAAVSQNLFHQRRTLAGEARWSVISFFYERAPTFLPEAPSVRERICGYMLLVEHRGHLAIFKSRLDLPSGFVTRYLGRVPVDRIDAAVAKADAIFEKIRLHHLSLSPYAMRNKTLEAADLRNVVGPAGSNRYAPQAYAVRTPTDHFAATPSTGRIAQRSDKVDHLSLIDYARLTIDEVLDSQDTPAEFIRLFARAIDLESIEGITRPISFAVDVPSLSDAIFEQEEIRLVRNTGDVVVAIDRAETQAILDDLAIVLDVTGTGKQLELVRPGQAGAVGAISINKSRIALRDLALPLMAEVEVEAASIPLGQDPDRMELRRYLDRKDVFLLLFDQLAYAYLDGTLYRDDGITGGGAEFLRYLIVSADLDAVTSEKGDFLPTSTAFGDTSTFGALIAHIADDDSVLVCDDLGDEWADFIGLDNQASPPRITFYHAKHGDLSLGAGPFHVAVSQAQKNLRNMSLLPDIMPAKMAGWHNFYISGNGVHTHIARVIRASQGVAQAFEEAALAPYVIRRAVIVTSSLSRAAVEQAFENIVAGQRPSPYFVQLYWLLSSFFSACIDMNVYGSVVCRP